MNVWTWIINTIREKEEENKKNNSIFLKFKSENNNTWDYIIMRKMRVDKMKWTAPAVNAANAKIVSNFRHI